MSTNDKKKEKETNRNIVEEPKLPITSMFQIKDALFYVRNQIEPSNTFVKQINEYRKEDCSKNSIILSIKDFYPYEFFLKDSYVCEKVVFDCLTLVQSNFEENGGENLYFSDFTKYRTYLQIIGSFSKLYGLIDTFENKIDTATTDNTYLKKLFSSIFTDLARLLPTIDDSEKSINPAKVLTLLLQLPQSEKLNILVTLWESKYALELDDPKAIKTLRYLLIESDAKLEKEELIALFSKMNNDDRSGFLKSLSDQLLPNEKRDFLTRIGV